jgi:hypothetical protein
MATTASEKPAAAEEGTPAERRFWRRIPTPIIVTLLGIVLSAWLLPAITRQWEDRQKAHDLEAALVARMTADTARILERARTNLYRESVPFLRLGEDGSVEASRSLAKRTDALPSERPPIEMEWSVASLRTESQLMAYWPDAEHTTLWHGYRQLVGSIIRLTAQIFARATSGQELLRRWRPTLIPPTTCGREASLSSRTDKPLAFCSAGLRTRTKRF